MSARNDEFIRAGRRSWQLLLIGGLLVGCAQGSSEADSPSGSSASAVQTAAVSAASAAAPATSSAAPAPLPPPLALATEGPYQVIDLHVDTPWRVHFKGRSKTSKKGHATDAELERGHYAGIVFPIYIPDYIHDSHPRIADADEILATIDAMVAARDRLVLAFAGEPAEAQPIPKDRVAAFVSIEGAGAFAEDVTQIDRFIARGVRLVGLCHAHDSALASSATGKKGAGGLTDEGKEIAARIYRAGALVDVSHMSDLAFDDLVPIAREHHAPIVATHSNARAVADHKRNLTDAQLRIIADSGGVAGLNLYRNYVGGKGRMADVVEQVRHMVEIAGVDHVAIGTDYDGGTPIGVLKDAAQMPALAEALVASGMTEVDVRKIFGGNALRILYWKPKG